MLNLHQEKQLTRNKANILFILSLDKQLKTKKATLFMNQSQHYQNKDLIIKVVIVMIVEGKYIRNYSNNSIVCMKKKSIALNQNLSNQKKVKKAMKQKLDRVKSNHQSTTFFNVSPTPQNKQTRTKFKPMSRVLQMVHVKSMISKLMLNSQPIKKPFFQSSPNTVSDFGSKSQYLQVPEPKEIQSPLTQLRMKTEPSPCQLQVHFAIDKNNFYYPRVSRISQLGIVSLLNISEGLENKNSKKLAPILTNRYKSPEKEKIRTLSQRVQSTYFRKSNSKVKDSVKKLL